MENGRLTWSFNNGTGRWLLVRPTERLTDALAADSSLLDSCPSDAYAFDET
jgi:hypothetical protein